MGVGATLGTVVSGLVAAPTLLLGGLVGAGYGAIKGPIIKFGGGGKSEKPKSDEQIRAEAMTEAESLDQAVEKGANTVPQRPQPIQAETMDGQAQEGAQQQRPAAPSRQQSAAAGSGESPQAERRRPRKLGSVSGNEVKAPPAQRKKPKKLEVRSGTGKKENTAA